MSACPRCGTKGRSITSVTLEAQVSDARLSTITQRDDWRLCLSQSCEVVYFREHEVVLGHETESVPFHKSERQDRLACFCFAHSVADIASSLTEDGTSAIRDSIKAGCKAGRDDCETKNPQGRCCLGNVGAVLKDAAAEGRSALDCGDTQAEDQSHEPPCCNPPRTEAPVDDSTMQESSTTSALPTFLSAGGALAVAVLSSACCWLPLVAVSLGVTSVGAGAVFERWRLPFLLATAVFLCVGFYRVYRPARCAEDESCAIVDRRLQRFNRRILWLATVLVAAIVFFPNYLALSAGGGDILAAETESHATSRYQIEGMTCAGCEATVRRTLESVDGVESATVSYQSRTGVVVWSGSVDDASIVLAIEALGYRAVRVDLVSVRTIGNTPQ